MLDLVTVLGKMLQSGWSNNYNLFTHNCQHFADGFKKYLSLQSTIIYLVMRTEMLN